MVLLSILKPLWKPALGVVIALLLVTGAYLKGRSDGKAKSQVKDLKEVIERREEAEKITDHGQKVIIRYRESVQPDSFTDPVKVPYYECLLGDAPLSCKLDKK